MFSGKRLIERRRAAGLTQEDLARRCHLTVGAVAKLEQGRIIDPRVSTCERLAEVLACSLADLLADSTSSPSPRRRGPAGLAK
jgi:transcriptional regulator with XRE-family HTH domain